VREEKKILLTATLFCQVHYSAMIKKRYHPITNYDESSKDATLCMIESPGVHRCMGHPNEQTYTQTQIQLAVITPII